MDINKKIAVRKAEEIVNILNKNGYNAIHSSSLFEAKKAILNLIPMNSSISVGGSMTITELDILDNFRTPDYNFFDRYNQSDFNSIVKIMKEGLLADYFITGTNAITKTGELIQIDGLGNRISAFLYGPKNLIVVAGVNKIVENLKDGIKRIKEYVAPINAKRLDYQTPCTITTKCENCLSPQKICNMTTIIKSGERMGRKINIIIISEEVGY